VDECILTYGYSKLVEVFLKAAGAKRRFQVFEKKLDYCETIAHVAISKFSS
jgi:hypothetical protein